MQTVINFETIKTSWILQYYLKYFVMYICNCNVYWSILLLFFYSNDKTSTNSKCTFVYGILSKVLILITLLFYVHIILTPIIEDLPNLRTKQHGKALCSKRLGWIYSWLSLLKLFVGNKSCNNTNTHRIKQLYNNIMNIKVCLKM